MKKITADSKIKAVVFDLDHTLFDRFETLRLTTHDMLCEHPEWFSKNVSEELVFDVIKEAEGRYIVASGWQAAYDYWAKCGILAYGEDGKPLAKCEEVFDFIWNYSFLRHAVSYPFANPMLDELRDAGLKIGLLTNAANETGIIRQRAKLRMLGMTDKFDEIIISGEVGFEKPDKRVFDIMTERMGIPANNMLYVGDNPGADVFGSKNAGYIPVWVRFREGYGETTDCEYSVADVSEIPALVDRINSEK